MRRNGSGFDKNQIIGDYTSLIAAMLPDMLGLRCLDRRKQPIFDEVSETDIEYSPAYHDAVKAILGSPEQACDVGRVELDGAIAFLLPLDGDKGKPVGVVSVLVDACFYTYLARSVRRDATRSSQHATRTDPALSPGHGIQEAQRQGRRRKSSCIRSKNSSTCDAPRKKHCRTSCCCAGNFWKCAALHY